MKTQEQLCYEASRKATLRLFGSYIRSLEVIRQKYIKEGNREKVKEYTKLIDEQMMIMADM